MLTQMTSSKSDYFYRRCQENAAIAARGEYDAALRSKKIKPGEALVCGSARAWVNLFDLWYKGKVDEEHIKGCIVAGYVPTTSPAWDGADTYKPKHFSGRK